MLRFIMGFIAGSVAVWMWREDIRDYADRKTRVLRSKAADQLRVVQEVTESVLDAAKEQISVGLESGQEAIRPSRGKVSAAR